MLDILAINDPNLFQQIQQVIGMPLFLFLVFLVIIVFVVVFVEYTNYLQFWWQLRKAETFEDHEKLFSFWCGSPKKRKQLFSIMRKMAEKTSEHLFLAANANKYGIMTNEEEWLEKAKESCKSFEDAMLMIKYKINHRYLGTLLEEQDRAFNLYKKKLVPGESDETKILVAFTRASWHVLLK